MWNSCSPLDAPPTPARKVTRGPSSRRRASSSSYRTSSGSTFGKPNAPEGSGGAVVSPSSSRPSTTHASASSPWLNKSSPGHSPNSFSRLLAFASAPTSTSEPRNAPTRRTSLGSSNARASVVANAHRNARFEANAEVSHRSTMTSSFSFSFSALAASSSSRDAKTRGSTASNAGNIASCIPSTISRRSSARRTCLDPFKCARSSSDHSSSASVSRGSKSTYADQCGESTFFGSDASRDARTFFPRVSPFASSITPPPFPGLSPRSPSVAPRRDGVFCVDRVAFALVNRSASASRVVAETCRGNSWSLSRTPPNRCVGARGSPPPPRATSPAAANALASRPSGPFWSITTDVVITSGTRSGDERTSDAFSAAVSTGANSGSEKMASPCLRFLVATPPTPIPRMRANRARSPKSTPCRLSQTTSAAI